MKIKHERIIKVILGIIILLILFKKVGFEEAFQTFLSIKLIYVPLVILVWLLIFLIGTFNIRLLLNSLQQRLSFSTLFRYYVTSWSLGLLTPGKLGEFSLIYFLKKEGVPAGEGAATLVIDKLITFFSLGVLATIGVFVFFGRNGGLKSATILLLIVIISICLISSEKIRGMIRKYILRKKIIQLNGFSKTFQLYIKKRKNILFVNFIITTIKWIISAIATYLIFLSFNFKILHFWFLVLIDAVVTIFALIPITINGLGIKESGAVLLFEHIGITGTITANVYILGTILTYFIAALLFFTFKVQKNKRK
jgi:uncharacterized protein (TIRG00374 family)